MFTPAILYWCVMYASCYILEEFSELGVSFSYLILYIEHLLCFSLGIMCLKLFYNEILSPFWVIEMVTNCIYGCGKCTIRYKWTHLLLNRNACTNSTCIHLNKALFCLIWMKIKVGFAYFWFSFSKQNVIYLLVCFFYYFGYYWILLLVSALLSVTVLHT